MWFDEGLHYNLEKKIREKIRKRKKNVPTRMVRGCMDKWSRTIKTCSGFIEKVQGRPPVTQA